jgi:hypothetical protein
VTLSATMGREEPFARRGGQTLDEPVRASLDVTLGISFSWVFLWGLITPQ